VKPQAQFGLDPLGGFARQPLGIRRRSERGTNLVEFALVIIVFMMMIFGIAGFGYAFYVYHGVSNLARSAARWASVNGSTCNSDRATTTDPGDVGSCTAPVTYNAASNTYSMCAGTSTSSCSYATESDIQNYVKMISSGLNASNILTTVKYPYNAAYNPPSCATATAPTENAPGCTVEVTVSYPFYFPVPLISNSPLTVSSSSEMIIVH
jgi:Flp pilus assembly protein TadG